MNWESFAIFVVWFQVYSSVSQPNERGDIITMMSDCHVKFDPLNKDHMIDFARFVKYNNWKNGCQYILEENFLDIPTMIRFKIIDQVLSQFAEEI